MRKGILTLEEARQEFINRNYTPLFDKYNNCTEKLLAKTQEGYLVIISINKLKLNQVPKFVGKSNPYTIQNIKLWCILNNKPFELISKEYKGTRINLEWKCLKNGCGEIFEALWNSIQQGQGCGYCHGLQTGLSNCLATKRPDLIKYLKNKEDGYKYTINSTQKINVVCPNCKFNREIKITNLTNNGFNCSKCGDGFSYPEKIMFNVLDQLNLIFIPQLTKTTFNWCQNYKYDFYLPFVYYIIETHGIQHYKENNWSKIGGKTLIEIQQNDNIKMKLALNNNIPNYIIIDCRYSELEWIKNSIMQSELPKLLNFKEEDIDWLQCHEFACNSLVKTVCDLWNKGINVEEISKLVKISNTTIYKYLYQGTKLNICYYNGQEEKEKLYKRTKIFSLEMREKMSITRRGVNNPHIRKIICINTNQIFKYIKQASIKYNINNNSIVACCRGKRKSAGKHPITGEKMVWMYYEDWELQQNKLIS